MSDVAEKAAWATARKDAKTVLLTTNWECLLDSTVRQGNFQRFLNEAYAYAQSIAPMEPRGASCPIRKAEEFQDLGL